MKGFPNSVKKAAFVIARLMLLIGLGFASPVHADNPGDACSPNGAAGVNGVMQMTCTSGVWVLNAAKLGNSSVTCNSGNAGYIKWDGDKFLGCEGASWRPLYGGPHRQDKNHRSLS